MSVECEKCGADIDFPEEYHPNCKTVVRLNRRLKLLGKVAEAAKNYKNAVTKWDDSIEEYSGDGESYDGVLIKEEILEEALLALEDQITKSEKTGNITVRQACRLSNPLGGADAQALEHALTITERERDDARSRLKKLEPANKKLKEAVEWACKEFRVQDREKNTVILWDRFEKELRRRASDDTEREK